MTTTPRGYRTGFVTLESEASLPAFLPEDNRRWNGFALPIFDPAVIAEHRETLGQMFPADPGNEDALVLTWDGDRPSIVDPQYADDPDGGEYVQDTVIDGVTYLSVGGGAFVWSEDPIVGYMVRNEHDEPMIYCAECASEKTTPVYRSQIAEEGELCAGTDFNDPSAHELEAEGEQ